MNTLEFNLDNQIMRFNLNKPNIIFIHDPNVSEELYQIIYDVLSIKRPGLFNLSKLTKNQFKLHSLSSSDSLESDLKLTSKSHALALIKDALSNTDEQFLSSNVEQIHSLIDQFISAILSSSPLNDYSISQMEPITLIKNFIDFYKSSLNYASPDYLLFSELVDLAFKSQNPFILINGFPRTMNLYEAMQILARIRLSAAGAVIITSDVNYMTFADIQKNCFCHYYLGGFFHKMAPLEHIDKSAVADKILFYNRLSIPEDQYKNMPSFFKNS